MIYVRIIVFIICVKHSVIHHDLIMLYIIPLLNLMTFSLSPSLSESSSLLLDIRLVGGVTKWDGYVEILHNKVWGSICADDTWTLTNAEVRHTYHVTVM